MSSRFLSHSIHQLSPVTPTCGSIGGYLTKSTGGKLGTHQIQNMPGFTLLEICMEIHWVARFTLRSV